MRSHLSILRRCFDFAQHDTHAQQTQERNIAKRGASPKASSACALKRALARPHTPQYLSVTRQWLSHVHQHHNHNFLSEGCRCCNDKEVGMDGTYLTYFPFSLTIEMQQMPLITRNKRTARSAITAPEQSHTHNEHTFINSTSLLT